MAQGWISLDRQVTDNWIWKDKPFAKGQAWVDILLRVNHKANKVPIGNQVVDVEEGQTIWSIQDMADRWGWSRKKVSNFLNILETESMLSQKRTSKYTLLTVVNWGLYQNKEHQKNINGTSMEHQKHTNNNDNNENNDNNSLSSNKFADDSFEMRASKYLFEKILLLNPKAKQPNFQSWCKHIDRMKRLDYRTETEIAKVMEWATNDPFWQRNILSTDKFRKQFDSLVIKMNTKKPSSTDRFIDEANEWLEKREAL